MKLVEALRRDVGASVVVVFSTIFLVASLWLTWNGGPLPPDALEYSEVARNLVRGAGYTLNLVEIHAGMLPGIRHLHELHGLLEPFLLAPLFALFGPESRLVRIPGLVFVAALAFATFLLGKRVSGSAAGCVAGLLVLARRDLSFGATLGGDDIGWAFFSTVAVFAFLVALSSRTTRWFVLAGAAAAFATLEKVTGAALPACFFATALLMRPRARLGVRAWSLLTLPAIFVLGVYALRNHAIHGGFGFRYSPLDWLSKDSPPAYFAFYEQAPKLADVFARLGSSRVLSLVREQFALLARAAADDALFLVGGPVALLWLARKRTAFASFGIVYVTAVTLVVCVAYHVEPRYLFALYPVYFVALATVALEVTNGSEGRARLAFASFGVVFVYYLVAVLRMERQIGVAGATKGACEPAMEFIRKTAGVNEPVLTSSPWFVTWATERPSVNVPTNGPAAVARVARHYGAKWAVDGMPTFGGADVRAALRAVNGKRGLRADRVFADAVCSVYRLNGD
ncbi:MAG TPA: glycosyltransferase family 39 protein [Polyangiaceae bacterium]|jgi:hypothetical protein|nr:glycosyltransferase family 39 protein [Polyangiaceae bacterium]